MDRIGRFECSKKHFTQRFRMSVAPNLHHPFHGILRSFRICQLVGEVGAGGRGGTGAVGVVFSVVEVVVGLFPVLPAGGWICTPSSQCRNTVFAHSLQDVPDRWNWAGSRSLICIHGTRTVGLFLRGGGSSRHSRRLLQTPDFPVESGLRAAWRRSCNAQTRRFHCRR